MKKTSARFLSVLLTLCMLLTLLPTVALAVTPTAGTAMRWGTGGIKTGDYISYGWDNWESINHRLDWQVLDAARTNFDSDGDETNDAGIFLLSRWTMSSGACAFRLDTDSDSNIWQDSNAQAWCKRFADLESGFETSCRLNTAESAAILTATKTDAAETVGKVAWGACTLTNEKVFFLSAQELFTYVAAHDDGVLCDEYLVQATNGTCYSWWLRSPTVVRVGHGTLNGGYEYTNEPVVGHILLNKDGDKASLSYTGARRGSTTAARPAFNLNPNSVLFSCAAEGGKSTEVGTLASNAAPAADVSSWKLTLKDTARSGFAAATTAWDARTKTATVAYSGAQVGESEYISAIVGKSGESIQYYGRIAQPDSASGTVKIDLSNVAIPSGSSLYVFSEQCNGDYKTDLASNLVEVPLSVNGFAVTGDLANMTSSGLSFVKSGTDYTATLSPESGYTLPATIAVKIGDAPLTTDENTYSYESATGALTIKAAAITDTVAITAAGVATTHTIIFDANGGSVGTASANTNTDGMLSSLPTPTRSGSYSFDGWYTAKTGGMQVTASFAFDTDTTIFARWTYTGSSNSNSGGGGTASYTLSFNVNGGSAISDVSKTSGATVDLTAYTPTRSSYTFAGWYSDAALTKAVTSVKLTANTTVYAKWTKATALPFTDVPEDAWYYGDVAYAYENGLFAGTSDTTFSPNAPMTRQMLWTVLGRLDGQTLEGSGVFDAARTWAMGKGITDGSNPGSSITREQLVTILWRYAGSPKSTGGLSKFTDGDTVASYAKEAMAWAVENGIVGGTSATTLTPGGTATRAQVAAILRRFAELAQ